MPDDRVAFDAGGPLPTGVIALEASAGTGKTYALSSLAARFVAERDIPASALCIVTYHYLRDRTPAVRPGFDALSPAGFAGQLDYFDRNYNVVHPRAVAAALDGGPALPDRALMLSFDDGLKEHYTIAFPMLHARGWGGVFYPPEASTRERRLLDVHKIHLVLARSPDRAALVLYQASRSILRLR